MNVLPQLERDLVEAHARVAARRNRVWRAWLVRRARGARTDPVGSRAKARGWALAGVRAVPALLAVGVVLALVAAFLVLAHAWLAWFNGYWIAGILTGGAAPA